MDWSLVFIIVMVVLMLPFVFTVVGRRIELQNAVPQMLLAIAGAAIGVLGTLAVKIFTEGNLLYLVPALSGASMLFFSTRLVLRTRRRNLQRAGAGSASSVDVEQDKRLTAFDVRAIVISVYVGIASVLIAVVGSIVAAAIAG